MSAPLLQLRNVSKSFGAVQALREVSFELQPAEVHALLGENGAGKSTLIKLITGAHQPDRGSIEINGQVVGHLSPGVAHRLGVACIYQQPALFPDLTVAENIGLRLESVAPFRRVHWTRRRERSAQLLERIGADLDPEAEVRDLSMPEQQLVEIACALGTGARVLIMDEPTASLTRKEQDLLFKVVRDLRQQGAGIIYISHRLEEIFSLADRVTVLRDGQSVGTSKLDAVNEAALIRLMVGRELAQEYPPRGSVPGEVLLSTANLGCAAGGIHLVNLELRAREIVGLAGLVGAGRTELARVLFGLTPADAGQITLRGQPVTISSPRQAVNHGIAYVPEDRRRHGVILEMPISANITMAIHDRLFPGTWLRSGREREVALRFIKELSVKTPGPDASGASLSGGNQQKVALARWLAAAPCVLILDEPTQGVDVGAKIEIHKIIRALADQGMAVLMISSDLPEILGLSDRILVMKHGTITKALPGGCKANDVMSAALGQSDQREFSLG